MAQTLDFEKLNDWRNRLREAREGGFVQWEQRLARCLEKHTHDALIEEIDWYAQRSVVLGMTYLKVENDFEQYEGEIGLAVSQALPKLVDLLDSVASAIPTDTPLQFPAAFEARTFTWIFTCCLLSDSSEAIERIRTLVEHPRVLIGSAKELVESWYALLSEGPLRERIASLEEPITVPVQRSFSDWLDTILRKDQTAFDELVAARAAEYAKRARNTPKYYEHGDGKFYNRVTFDAWGVAYCKLARLHGLEVNVDSPHLPAIVIQSMLT